ncbi:MAG: hypothetical protein ACRDKL_07160 [Solirubrobacteraceae bacterium]
MSESEDPRRLSPDHEATLEDVLALTGPSTPHFALHARGRLRALIKGLEPEHPARIEGERQIAALDQIAFDGEIRGRPAEPGLPPLASVTAPPTSAPQSH